MEDSDIFTITISSVALVLSGFSIWLSARYSSISVLHSLHEIILQKAKDCNIIHQQAADTSSRSGYSITMQIEETNMVSEIIISVQLLDNSLKRYGLTNRRDFFLLQFWIQLHTAAREYIKNNGYNQLSSKAQKNLDTVFKIFKCFFKEY